MPLIELDNPDDPRLAVYRDLKRTNLTRWAGRFIAEGDKLVRRLLASPFSVESVVLGRRYVAEMAALVPAEVPVYVLPGIAKYSVVVSLGHGRTHAGRVAGSAVEGVDPVGFNTYPLRTTKAMWSAGGVRPATTGYHSGKWWQWRYASGLLTSSIPRSQSAS